MSRFKKVGIKYTKHNKADVVTAADLLVNKYLVAEIKKKYPTHGIISEEMGQEKTGAQYVWVIDPLDGTRNFATRVPMWGTMVGLTYRGQMILSAIYEPNLDEFLFAEKGKGTYLNNKRAHCSKTREVAFSYGVGSSTFAASDFKWLKPIAREAERRGGFGIWMNDLGSMATAVAFVASGRRDWKISEGSGIWDYAPPALVMSEAGCKISRFNGQPWQFGDREIVAANPILHNKLIKLINAK